MDPQGTLVLIESDKEHRDRLAERLHALGFVVFACGDAAEALRLLWLMPAGRIHQLWLEQNLSDLPGTDFLWYALESCHAFTRIVLMASDFEPNDLSVEPLGASSRIVCLRTPLDFTAIEGLVI